MRKRSADVAAALVAAINTAKPAFVIIPYDQYPPNQAQDCVESCNAKNLAASPAARVGQTAETDLRVHRVDCDYKNLHKESEVNKYGCISHSFGSLRAGRNSARCTGLDHLARRAWQMKHRQVITPGLPDRDRPTDT